MKKREISCNKTFNKNEIKKLIYWFLTNYGSIRTTKLLDELKFLGFNYATTAGISLGIEDLKIPTIKTKLIKNTEKSMEKTETKLETGKIDILKKLEKITESWNNTNEVLKNELITNFRQTDLLNPVYMMTFSGARGMLSTILKKRTLLYKKQIILFSNDNLTIKDIENVKMRLTKRKVDLYDLTNNFIKPFDSVIECANFLNVKPCEVRMCCSGKRSRIREYITKY